MNGFWQDRRVLITGAGGFLGGYLAARLLERGAHVVGLDLEADSRCLAAHGIAGHVNMIEGSVMDPDRVERAITAHRVETVFHLAGQSMIGDAAASPAQTFELNVRGTWIVLDAAHRSGTVQAVVTASSNHTYGSQHSSPFPESAPMNQLDPYGASKACADIVTRSFAAYSDLGTVAVRNVNSFGGADPHMSHIVTGTIMALLRDEAPVIRSDGSPVKAYLHASDTMSAYVALAERAREDGVRGEAFNVTPEAPVSVIDLVDAIVRVSGKTHLRPHVLATDLSQQGYFEHLSDAKLRARIGWTPRLSLEDGLRQTYDWYAMHGADWL